MEPFTGLIIILALAGLNALIAHKRRRSAFGFFALSVLPVVPLAAIMARLSGGDGTAMGWAAFAAPVVTFIAVIAVANGQERAAQIGAHGDYVKCPLCAEPVRKEAIKCRHCGSELAQDAQTVS